MNHQIKNSDSTTAENVLNGILDELDAVPTSQQAKNRRIEERFKYRKNRLIAWIQQPGDTSSKKYSVMPRNLSEGGIGFLHNGFVHAKSKVVVQLDVLLK